MSGSRVAVRTPEGEVELELPLPGLYNVYNALAALAAALRLGVGLERAVAGARRASRPSSGGSRRSRSTATPVSILLIKNPAGANEVLRTLRLEAGERRGGLDLWIALNDRIADGRDVSWIWDADFELLAGARAAGRLRGHPGAGDGGAAQVRGLDAGRDRGRARRSSGSLDRAVAAADGPLFALPTYTALLELRTLLAVARPRRGVLAVSAATGRRGDLARRRVRRLRRRPGALGASSPREAAGPVLELGAGTGRVALAPRRATATRSIGARPLARRCSTSCGGAPTRAGSRSRRVVADARDARARAPLRARSSRRCSSSTCSAEPAGARERCGAVRRHLRRRRRVRRRAARRAGAAAAPRPAAPPLPDVRERRRLGLLEPAGRGARRRRRARDPAPAPARLARRAS